MNVNDAAASSTALPAAETDTRHSITRAIVIWILAAGLVAAMTIAASGQQPKYDEIKVNPLWEEPATLKKMQTVAKKLSVTRDKQIDDLNYGLAYFSRYIPAKITNLDAKAEITPLMEEAYARYSSAVRGGYVAKDYTNSNQIIRALYTGLRPVALGNYHPAARINAILLISLDEAPGTKGRVGTPPTPFRHILRDFVPIYENAKNPDGVRAAALQGIHRYVMLAAPAVKGAELNKIKLLMTNLLTSDPPPGRSAKAHAYLQRFAVDILSNLRGQADPVLGQQLISISTETKKPDLIALHAAARIGDMTTDIKGKVNAPKDILDSWAVRAMRAFQYEAIRLQALDRPTPASPQPRKPEELARRATDPKAAAPGMEGEMMRGPEEMGGMEDMEEMGEDMMSTDEMMQMMMGAGAAGERVAAKQPPEVFVSRRKLNHVLQQLHQGATGSAAAILPTTPGGLLGSVAPADKTAIEEWLTAMDEVLTALNDDTLETRKAYIAALQDQVEVLRKIAGTAAEAAEAESARRSRGRVTRGGGSESC